VHRSLQLLGRSVWWCGWPVLWLYLHDSNRTRLLLLNESGQVLLVKGWISATSKWSLPGGGLHGGENPMRGLLREVNEEVGLALNEADVVPLEVRRMKSKGLRFNLHFYRATIDSTPVLRLQRHEIAECAWVEPASLTAANAEPDVLVAVSALAR
jgi:8-oxo-dGTP diphosphatase